MLCTVSQVKQSRTPSSCPLVVESRHHDEGSHQKIIYHACDPKFTSLTNLCPAQNQIAVLLNNLTAEDDDTEVMVARLRGDEAIEAILYTCKPQTSYEDGCSRT